MTLHRVIFLLLLLLPLRHFHHNHHYAHAQPPYDYPSANLSTTWTNSPTARHTVPFPADGTTITAILLRQSPSGYGPSFAFGFYCRDPCNEYLLSIFIVYTNSGALITNPTLGVPQVVWSANRDTPVKANSTLELTKDGDLVLKDADGSLAWSTNTTGKSVVGLNLTSAGDLVLHDAADAVVWQSFDHPTDSLLSGQRLVEGQRLTANESASKYWTRGQLYISYTQDGFRAFVDSNPPQAYYKFSKKNIKLGPHTDPCFVSITDQAFTFVANSSSSSDPNGTLEDPPASAAQFLRLESDGHLRLYEWGKPREPPYAYHALPSGWSSTDEVVKPNLGECAFPTVCGNYGICSHGGQCRCPPGMNSTAPYFKPMKDTQPNLGCSALSPLSCKSLQQHRFLELEDVSYFNYDYDAFLYRNLTTVESCKEECLRNCSCKAALFQYGSSDSSGSCYLPNEIFSLMNNVQQKSRYNSTAYVKVQAPPLMSQPPSSPEISASPSHSSSTPLIVGVTIGAVVGVLIILGIATVVYKKTRAKAEDEEEEEEEDFPQLPGLPTRFSYEDMRSSTENFAKKLGSGGFGSVFEGTLVDGTRVAVKKLESVRQGNREFLAEVQTIGNIHHLNLVRLIGFCVERSHKLLVYEYMSNGSLDKWIFEEAEGHELTWETCHKIICDVAKGLLYLHEECRQKIAHLDIKPQNILLDSNFNAKVADFGLAKLIDRDQSAVMTMMRGTPGYLAPEWLTSVITEKVDVYSFGVVIVEIVCRRRNLDYSQPEESMHLLPLLKEKAIMGQLLDILDERDKNMPHNVVEMVKMLKLAIWCLQNDTGKRPSMSMVMKVLEGTMEISEDLNYDFTAPGQRTKCELEVSSGSSPLLLRYYLVPDETRCFGS